MGTQGRGWASGRCRVKGKQPADVWDFRVLQHEGGTINLGSSAELSSLKGRTGRWRGRAGEQKWGRGLRCLVKMGGCPLVKRGGMYTVSCLGERSKWETSESLAGTEQGIRHKKRLGHGGGH